MQISWEGISPNVNDGALPEGRGSRVAGHSRGSGVVHEVPDAREEARELAVKHGAEDDEEEWNLGCVVSYV